MSRANDMVLLLCDQDHACIPINQDSAVQIVRNLLDNAERHNESSVTVSIDHFGETIEFRCWTTTARSLEAGGSGLGLAIVGTIVTCAGSEIHVDDRHGSPAGLRRRRRVAVVAVGSRRKRGTFAMPKEACASSKSNYSRLLEQEAVDPTGHLSAGVRDVEMRNSQL